MIESEFAYPHHSKVRQEIATFCQHAVRELDRLIQAWQDDDCQPETKTVLLEPQPEVRENS